MRFYLTEHQYISTYTVNTFQELIEKMDYIAEHFTIILRKVSFSVCEEEPLLEGRNAIEWAYFITFYVHTRYLLYISQGLKIKYKSELNEDTKWLKNYLTVKAKKEMRVNDNKKNIKECNTVIVKFQKDLELLKQGNTNIGGYPK